MHKNTLTVVFILSAIIGLSNGIRPLVSVDPEMLVHLDSRVCAINSNPELIPRLDQKEYYEDKKYASDVQTSLNFAGAVLPGIFSKKEREHLSLVSASFTDSRVFFAWKKDDLASLGYIPLVNATYDPLILITVVAGFEAESNADKVKRLIQPRKDVIVSKDEIRAEELLMRELRAFVPSALLKVHRIQFKESVLVGEGMVVVSGVDSYMFSTVLSERNIYLSASSISEEAKQNGPFEGSTEVMHYPFGNQKRPPLKLDFWPPKNEKCVAEEITHSQK